MADMTHEPAKITRGLVRRWTNEWYSKRELKKMGVASGITPLEICDLDISYTDKMRILLRSEVLPLEMIRRFVWLCLDHMPSQRAPQCGVHLLEMIEKCYWRGHPMVALEEARRDCLAWTRRGDKGLTLPDADGCTKGCTKERYNALTDSAIILSHPACYPSKVPPQEGGVENGLRHAVAVSLVARAVTRAGVVRPCRYGVPCGTACKHQGVSLGTGGRCALYTARMCAEREWQVQQLRRLLGVAGMLRYPARWVNTPVQVSEGDDRDREEQGAWVRDWYAAAGLLPLQLCGKTSANVRDKLWLLMCRNVLPRHVFVSLACDFVEHAIGSCIQPQLHRLLDRLRDWVCGLCDQDSVYLARDYLAAYAQDTATDAAAAKAARLLLAVCDCCTGRSSTGVCALVRDYIAEHIPACCDVLHEDVLQEEEWQLDRIRMCVANHNYCSSHAGVVTGVSTMTAELQEFLLVMSDGRQHIFAKQIEAPTTNQAYQAAVTEAKLSIPNLCIQQGFDEEVQCQLCVRTSGSATDYTLLSNYSFLLSFAKSSGAISGPDFMDP